MNSISKTITKAVILQSIGTIFLGSAFYILFFSFTETVDFFAALWLPILVGFLAMLFSAKIIGNSFSQTFKFSVWHGLAIIFALLIIAIVTGVLATQLLSDWDKVDIQDVFSVILVFLVFGGLPTLCVGTWLGYSLSKFSNN